MENFRSWILTALFSFFYLCVISGKVNPGECVWFPEKWIKNHIKKWKENHKQKTRGTKTSWSELTRLWITRASLVGSFEVLAEWFCVTSLVLSRWTVYLVLNRKYGWCRVRSLRLLLNLGCWRSMGGGTAWECYRYNCIAIGSDANMLGELVHFFLLTCVQN